MSIRFQPGPLQVGQISGLLRTRTLGRNLIYLDSTDSTNLLASRLSADGAPSGTVVVADHQTAGRGRLGRSWSAPPGTGIQLSVLLRPPAGARIQELSLVGGLAVAETVEAALDLSAQIKWPNDVMVDRRKVAGVLAEARDGIVVLGIGLNVNQTRDQLPGDARVPAASLRTVDGVVRERAPLVADLLARLEEHYDAWCDGGLDAVFDGIGSRDFLRGRRVSVGGVEGIGGGLDRAGRLLVDGRAVESGEVEFVR